MMPKRHEHARGNVRPDLRNVTAVCFDHRNPRAAVKLLAAMSDRCDFGDIKYLNFFDGYPQFLYWENYEFFKYIKTPFALFMHLDGYVVHPDLWEPAFLGYDYIGAPWPADLNPDRVGNGGFCIKSFRLMCRVAQLPWVNLPGDVLLCSHYRRQLEGEGFRFAPVDVAARFAVEYRVAETPDRTFGFHGPHNYPAWTEDMQ